VNKADAVFRVIVADDHPIYREGLADAIRAAHQLALVGEAGDGRQALSLILAESPDVALLDLSMPELDGLEVLRELREHGAATKVACISAALVRPAVHDAITLGARAVLSKAATRREICTALVRVADGEVVLAPEAQTILVEEVALRSEAPQLSRREVEVLSLAAQGHSAPSIATLLIVSPTTVRTHLKNAYIKLGVADRTAAVARAMQLGLLP
jgi:two-component system nitrate/nitrite response regulator NarL